MRDPRSMPRPGPCAQSSTNVPLRSLPKEVDASSVYARPLACGLSTLTIAERRRTPTSGQLRAVKSLKSCINKLC
jgi:hypothetical protein